MKPTLALTLALLLSLSACSEKGTGLSPGPVQEETSGPETNFRDVLAFPFDQIQDGGPGKDGIPALTDPTFVKPDDRSVFYLKDDDLVLGLAVNGQAKAYPHNIFWHHEIVNDTIDGHPVIVTFCPLTGTGMVFDGKDRDGSRITAGVTGLLFNNNLIMYDRRDDQTLYPQMISKAIQGPRIGRDLTLLPAVETTWRYWKRLYPNTTVISGITGVYTIGTYFSYPYIVDNQDYRSAHEWIMAPVIPALKDNPVSLQYGAKQMALGVRFNEHPKAYPFSKLGDEALVNDTVGGNPIVVLAYGQEQLVLAYFRTAGNRTLTFEKAPSSDPVFPFLMRDRETGSTWNLKGEAIDGSQKGAQLALAPAHNAFWFAWTTFWRDTEVY